MQCSELAHALPVLAAGEHVPSRAVLPRVPDPP